MKLLILGGNGMAGHVLVRYFRQHAEHEVVYTMRSGHDAQAIPLDASDLGELDRVLEQERPDVVINAVGILNQHADQDEKQAFIVNGLVPHRIANKLDAMAYGGKLVHISTDCVFSGERGDYTEAETPDGTSTYARTKAAGEVQTRGHLTVRTSIIGPEVRDHGIGLMAWFMAQSGTVNGYTRVYWNGVTTLQLAKSIEQLLAADREGLVHLTAPQKVSKCELLQLMAEVFGKEDVDIVPDGQQQLDRTLRSTRTDVKVAVPDYRVMLTELRDWMRSV